MKPAIGRTSSPDGETVAVQKLAAPRKEHHKHADDVRRRRQFADVKSTSSHAPDAPDLRLDRDYFVHPHLQWE